MASDPEQAESEYAKLAAWAKRPVPKPGHRIRRIEFVHDGVRWTAEVGQTLVGKTLDRSGSATGSRRTDPATVLAIFSGSPYMVVTNARPLPTGIVSHWLNPFMAGQPDSVDHFDPPSS